MTRLTRTLQQLLAVGLPLNRKERYYTGTVLPALLCSDAMVHLPRLGGLLELPDPLVVRADPDDCTVLFFSEYSLIESAIGVIAERFPGMASLPKDTPDVVILVTEPAPVLIALEAKLYDRPSNADLTKQLTAQRAQLDQIAEHLSGPLGAAVSIEHAALLPQGLADVIGELPARVITWEQILDTYGDVDQPYFLAVLAHALDQYLTLVSPWGGYQQGDVPGAALVRRHLAGDDTWSHMGAKGGLSSSRVIDRAADGTWTTTLYQARHEPLPWNSNWFTVAEFVACLIEAGVDLSEFTDAPTT